MAKGIDSNCISSMTSSQIFTLFGQVESIFSTICFIRFASQGPAFLASSNTSTWL